MSTISDRWKYADYAALLFGAAAMLMFFFNWPRLGHTAEAAVCFILGAAGLAYLAGGLWMWLRRRIEFDWMLVKGNFMRKVLCLVTLLPFSLTSAILLCGIDAQTMLTAEGSSSGIEDPSIFWTVFYHIIDPGNQHMVAGNAALGWTALLAVLGMLLLGGLLVTTLINWFDKRREQWLSGKIRYGERQFGAGFAIVIGANEIVASVIRNLLSDETSGLRAGDSAEKRRMRRLNFRSERYNRNVILQTSRNPEEVRDELSSHLPAGELRRVVIYSALRDSKDEIGLLHPQLASEIYVLGESTDADPAEISHDALNMKCVNLLAAELGRRRGAVQKYGDAPKASDGGHEDARAVHRKVCKVLFEYQTTYSVFQFSDIPGAVKENLVFIPFNRYECWAQRVLVDGAVEDAAAASGRIGYTPLDGYDGLPADSDEFVHFIIIGMSKTGVAMGVEAAFQAHYPNFRRARTRISFIASDADREMRFMTGRYKSLFGLARHRFLDLSSAGAEAPDPAEGWTDPMEQDGCPWRHLSEDGANFIDTEFEFVKGDIESGEVRGWLRKAAAEKNARLTVAVCLNQTHQAVAASLYLPQEVYLKAQQIWVFQKESADIILNLNNTQSCDRRYEKLRPFGMLYGEYMRDRSSYLKAVLVNGAYELDGEEFKASERDMADKKTWKDLRERWKKLTVAQQWSNRYFADSMYQKLRAVCGRLPEDMFSVPDIQKKLEGAVANNALQLAECEHNRWNMQQLLMEFSPADAATDEELRRMNARLEAARPSLEAWKAKVGWQSMNKDERKKAKESDEYMATEYGIEESRFDSRKKELKFGVARVHPNICSYSHLDAVDSGAKPYDKHLNAAIPAILIMVDGWGKVRLKDSQTV